MTRLPPVLLSAAQTKFGKSTNTGRELALVAARDALEGIGMSSKEIQACYVANAFGLAERQGHLGPLIMTGLGNAEAPSVTLEAACSSGAAAVHEAYAQVKSGLCDVVLVVGTEKVSHLDTITATTYFTYGGDTIFEGGCGASFPGLYATIARAHMIKYGTTEEQMAMVAVKNHENGLLNPKAHLHKRITVRDVIESPKVAEPLKLFDCCPFSDGAAAAIICSEGYASRYTNLPVRILASARAGAPASLHLREDLTSLQSARIASATAYRQANLQPSDVDFAEVHDCFTIAELVAMEDLGLSERGMAGEMVAEGRTSLRGEIPINPSGGLKAKGHPVGATGIGQVVEVFEQLNRRAGERQVKEAEVALSHNVGATGGSCSVHIFGV